MNALAKNNALSPIAAEFVNNLSGTYATSFWDGLYEVTASIDTVCEIKTAVEALHGCKKDQEAYHLILALYDLAALELPAAVSELGAYPDGVTLFIQEFLLDIEDLLYDYRAEEQEEYHASRGIFAPLHSCSR